LLPIRDLNPARSPAIATGLLLLVSVAVFLGIQPSGSADTVPFLYETATIPCEVVTGAPLSVEEIRSGRCIVEDTGAVFPEKHVYLSLLVSIFLHGNLVHLLGNMWMFWIFGNNVEDAMGHGRFVVFYLVGGVLAGLAHVVMQPGSTIPVVGASGAIAAVMGAYLVLYPRAWVQAIVPPLFFFPFHVPAIVFLGIWFVSQFGLAGQETNIAWEAHVAGFAFGAVWALARRRRLLARHAGR
jgi:membrane associated rhomboid family serine protease